MSADPLHDARAFLAQWVRPRADSLDRSLPALREALSELGRRGYLGLRIPKEFGGLELGALDFRRFQEASARASGALAFLESQHQSACGLVVRSPNSALRSRLLPRLASGRESSAIAFSQLRRSGPPAISAAPTPGGYRLDGHLSWVTGWGLFTHCVTAAVLPDQRVLFAYHPLVGSSALLPSKPLELAAMAVTQTVAVDVRGLFIPEADVVDLHPATWIQENDRIAVALQSPLALGCAQAAIDVLQDEATRKARPAMIDAARRLEDELESVREEAYQAMEENIDLSRSLRSRSAAIELAGRAAHAAVVAAAGAGAVAGHPAQRVYREALAFSVLALSPPIQDATLQVLSDRHRSMGGGPTGAQGGDSPGGSGRSSG
ncbi:MAG TPA: acyl-CoA dehydrogenase family protein [Planctomycetota bacterium]|nr:acyl-CoA dehydrogenase family protein [Planctomycetota bacterium]